MPFWSRKQPEKTSWTSKPQNTPHGYIPPHPRWVPIPNALSFTHRINFNPGAPAFTYNQYGPLEYPVLAGFNNRFQFKSMQPPAEIYGQAVLRQGLGQSWTAQPPQPQAAFLYTKIQLDAMTRTALAGPLSYYGAPTTDTSMP